MPATSPKTAVDRLLQRFRVVVGGVTDHPVFATGYRVTAESQSLSFVPLIMPVALRRRQRLGRILFQIKCDYTVEVMGGQLGGYEARVSSYANRILDAQEREIIAFHWHPYGASPETAQHLHLSGRLSPLHIGDNADPVALGEMHIPTGVVWLEDVVRLLITEFDVQPKRDDWETCVRRTAADSRLA